MADQWRVLTDTRRHDKRWVEIEDTVNHIKYSGYFPLSSPDSAIENRFKDQVRIRREEIAKKGSTLDLTNFEGKL